jgi:hypothetical protein
MQSWHVLPGQHQLTAFYDELHGSQRGSSHRSRNYFGDVELLHHGPEQLSVHK